MKRVSYAGGTFVTGDLIADAVARFATANANLERSAEIQVPALGDDGSRLQIGLVIGPASQMLYEPVTADSELVDDEFVDRLHQLTDRLITSAGVNPSPQDSAEARDSES